MLPWISLLIQVLTTIHPPWAQKLHPVLWAVPQLCQVPEAYFWPQILAYQPVQLVVHQHYKLVPIPQRSISSFQSLWSKAVQLWSALANTMLTKSFMSSSCSMVTIPNKKTSAPTHQQDWNKKMISGQYTPPEGWRTSLKPSTFIGHTSAWWQHTPRSTNEWELCCSH